MLSDWYNLTMKKSILIILTITLLLLAGCAQVPDHSGTDKPVTIAVIDTGFSSEAIPKESVLEGKNYLNSELGTEDTYGHGTAIASVILSICPEAKLVPLVSNAFDNGNMTQVDNDVLAQMIRDAVDVYDCNILNISAGIILDKDSICDAIQYAEESGVLVVASAGNDYADYNTIKYYPAAYETVLAVGSINKSATAISDFSQRGKWVDIYVCGEDVTISTLSGNSRTSDGTSYSAAKITAHAAKIIQQAENHITPSDLRQTIIDDAQSLSGGVKYIK